MLDSSERMRARRWHTDAHPAGDMGQAVALQHDITEWSTAAKWVGLLGWSGRQPLA
jgi:hypothetical protein